VFLDSGIFIAFLDQSDNYHEAALRFFARPPRQWFTSVLVVSETYGWFLHRFNEEAARRFRVLLDDLPRLKLLAADAAHHQAVCRTFDKHRGRKLTYVDASSLVWLRDKAIAEVWGTDRDLAIEGARVVPLSA
jgi:predicted nucleic acid-binding protein